MIRADGVSKWFGDVHAVRGVSFDIPGGQVVGLLGPNGAGKTTTIRMAAGFIPPTQGRLTICGHDTVDHSILARRSIGYLPESAPLYPEMRIIDYLSYRGRLHGMSRSDRTRGIAAAMDRCELAKVARRRIGGLSKGFRQRVGLAAALIHDPPVLILDEPTSGLDPAQVRHTRALLRDLASKRTVIISSHILHEIERSCDRVLIMSRGLLQADGRPTDLLAELRKDARYIIEAYVRPQGQVLDKLVSVLKAIPGVTDAQSLWCQSDDRDDEESGWTRLIITPSATTPDLRERLAAGLADAGIHRVRELRREEPTLEQLFLRLIDQDAPPQSSERASI